MTPSLSDLPSPNEIELSVFGPGYGEALALHVGNGKWLLVDSCLDPESGLPAGLNYLIRLGVDVSRDVKLVIASHWHDDHIRGLSGAYNACQCADLVISSVLRSREFRKLVALYEQSDADGLSGIDEFSRVFQFLQARKTIGVQGQHVLLAVADKVVWSDEIVTNSGRFGVSVAALSPSDSAVLLAQMALAEQSPKPNTDKRRLVTPSPNHASVVLWVEAGDICVLLGADLEHTNDQSTGWTAIVANSRVAKKDASAVKIPHHGSQTGHSDAVWSDLLVVSPHAVLTPFRHGRHLLPTPRDVERIVGLTSNAYITAYVKAKPINWRRRVVADFVAQMTESIEPVHTGWGHVRLRRTIDDEFGEWQVALAGDAHKLTTK